jgi:hypothetical protein
MPVAASHLSDDFYVYQFQVDAYPFYVAVGRSQRGPDSVRYVRSLMTPSNAAKLARSSLSNRVIAALIQQGMEPAYSRTSELVTRPEALVLERKQLAQLLAKGFLLTNWQHNPHRHRDVGKAVRAILSKQLVPISN